MLTLGSYQSEKSSSEVFMSPTARCANCGTVGFVRHEHVIRGVYALIRHYCGVCQRVWDEVEESDDPRPLRPSDGAPDLTTTALD